MRRTFALLITLGSLIVLAEPAVAAEAPPPRNRPIHLSCEATTSEDKSALQCSWDAYAGADAYRVVVAVRRRHTLVVHRHRVEATEFTRRVAPGRFNVFVRAVDEDRHPIARSNRVRVVVPRPVS